MQNETFKIILSGLWLLVFCQVAKAGTTYVCHGTYQTIMVGYSTAQVEAACGKPAQIIAHNKNTATPEVFEQWVYTMTNSNEQNTVAAPQLLITFDNNTVSEISTNNQAAASIFPCYRNGQIAIGSDKNTVQRQCGFPSYLNRIQRASNNPVKIAQWAYDYGHYEPQILVTFENDKVISINMGPMGR